MVDNGQYNGLWWLTMTANAASVLHGILRRGHQSWCSVMLFLHLFWECSGPIHDRLNCDNLVYHKEAPHNATKELEKCTLIRKCRQMGIMNSYQQRPWCNFGEPLNQSTTDFDPTRTQLENRTANQFASCRHQSLAPFHVLFGTWNREIPCHKQ